MASDSLIIGAGSSTATPAFVQQGQIDWVAFGNTAWTATSAVLQRFALAGVQPVTYGAGICLASQFHLNHVGQRRIEEAVERLHGVSVFRQLLWLGFGYQSLVNTLAQTVGGIKCVALCACLANVHTEVSAAWILSELWSVSEFPEQYKPSHSQFLALIKACTGVITETSFGETVDGMLGDMLWKRQSEPAGRIDASNAHEIAKALRGLFRISRKEVDSILVTGKSECGFVAALAYWLFDFRVHVEDEQHNIIFPRSPDHRPPQVVIQYGAASNKAIQIASTTYILGNYTSLFDNVSDPQEKILLIRTPWDGCLLRVFGATFLKLTKLPLHLGSYLGSVARIYSALALGQRNVGSLSRLQFGDYVETSHGQGLVHTIFFTFPELQRIEGLQNAMQVAVGEASFDQAMREVERSLQVLENLCGCFKCSPPSGSSIEHFDFTAGCVVRLAYAIREISRAMAHVVQDSQYRAILPCIEGIKVFSERGEFAKYEQESNKSDGGNLEHGGAIFARDALGLGAGISHPLYAVSLLFQGPDLPERIANAVRQQKQRNITALSKRGVVCYMNGLCELSCQAESVRLVHVMPGHIYYNDRQYDSTQDSDTSCSTSVTGLYMEDAQVHDATTSCDDINIVRPRLTVAALAAEVATEEDWVATERGISCVYRITTPAASVQLYPGKLFFQTLRQTGRIACNGVDCASTLAFPCSIVRSGWTVHGHRIPNLTYVSRIACCIWPFEDEVARCIILENHCNAEGISSMTFVRRRECLPCATKSILDESSKNIAKLTFGGAKAVLHLI